MGKKYLAVFIHSFIESIQYRTESIVWFFLDLAPIIILFFVWKDIFAGSSQIKGYTLSTMIEYYFLFSWISVLTSAHFEDLRSRQIRLGKIDFFLTRPLSFPSHIFWEYCGSKAFQALITAPAVLGLFFVLRATGITFPTVTPIQVVQFSILLAGSFVIEFYLALLIVYLTFWFEGANSLEHFKWITISILGGILVPRPFMPPWMQKLVAASPFQYLYIIPIEIVQGLHTLNVFDVTRVVGFIAFMMLLCHVLWQKAQRRYTSAGG